MGISLRDHKKLWGRAGNRCAIPACRNELVVEAEGSTEDSIIGEECHIVARKPGGPRGDSPLTIEQRDSYSNLILLCRNHHRTIDDMVTEFPVDQLHTLKHSHESWVKESLEGFDAAKQRDDETYSGIIDHWQSLSRIDEWKTWSTSMLSSGQPSISADILEDLKQLKEWLFNRIWPQRYANLEDAFLNFRLVLSDLVNVFTSHFYSRGDWLYTKKYYQIDEWDSDLYNRLSTDFEFHVDLVMDLMLELTRAGNYVCDQIRSWLDTEYRISEGALVVESGPFMDLTTRVSRVEYRRDERTDIPYPGLDNFKRIRKTRDKCIGLGEGPTDPEFVKWNNTRE